MLRTLWVQDSVGKSTWRQTQCTHMAGIQGLTTAFPVRGAVASGHALAPWWAPAVHAAQQHSNL